jgi:hypothetical protein
LYGSTSVGDLISIAWTAILTVPINASFVCARSLIGMSGSSGRSAPLFRLSASTFTISGASTHADRATTLRTTEVSFATAVRPPTSQSVITKLAATGAAEIAFHSAAL